MVFLGFLLLRVTLIIYILGINTLATLVQATENADEASTEVFKDAWFQPHTTPQENTIEVLGHYPMSCHLYLLLPTNHNLYVILR